MSVLFDPYDLYIPRHTSLALSISLIAHAVLFTIGWKLYKAETPPSIRPSLSIVLVSRKTLHAPKTARSWAQTNLDGGGRPDERGHSARTTTIDHPTQQEMNISGNQNGQSSSTPSNDPKPAQQGSPTPTTPYYTRKGAASVALQHPESASEHTPQTTPPVVQVPPATPNIAGKLSETLDSGQEGRGSKVLGASTREYRFAEYFEGWRTKIERIGTEHYRSIMSTRNPPHGTVLISLSVRADGQLVDAKIRKSSGNAQIDKMMIDIAHRASPFPPFPDALRAEKSVMEITRTWRFEKSSRLQTGDD